MIPGINAVGLDHLRGRLFSLSFPTVFPTMKIGYDWPIEI